MISPRHKKNGCLFFFSLFFYFSPKAQTNLLLNGSFEDVNTCTEYQSECGVEAWFYLKDVQAQMLGNEINTTLLGNNSFGIFYKWNGYENFSPVIGSILPCGLQKGKRYTFKGIIAAKLDPQLILRPGICMGQQFFVPRRPFSKTMYPDSITVIKSIPGSSFFQFEFCFIADGSEKYLTFGTYINKDTTGAKKQLIGVQTVSLVLDNFQLIPGDGQETICPGFLANKEKIYEYNFRHKEMDYSLFGRGELPIKLSTNDSSYFTKEEKPVAVPKTDTLLLGDVFFDFNKAVLKPAALDILKAFFLNNNKNSGIDSIYVEGHTDSIGADERNLTLSLERCESVKQWLMENKVLNTDNIQVHPFGESKPIARNNTADGRAINRRVEMIIFKKPEKNYNY